MSLAVWYALASVTLFTIGFYHVFHCDHLLRKILALNIMGSGVFLFLVAKAYRLPGTDPDPVPHAMVLTGIVVTVSSTALALVLARRLHSKTGMDRLPEALRSARRDDHAR